MSEKTARKAVVQAADQLWEEELDFLGGLVRYRSLRGQTNLIQNHLASWMEAEGLKVHKVGIDVGLLTGRPGFSPVDWGYDGLVNLVGSAQGVGGGRSLVLNGHVDVVSPEPADRWSHDPWGAEVEDGRMYGRGACDMKAGVAAMIFAVKAARRAGVALRGDVLLQTVIDEECSGNGTLACLEAGYRGDAAIVVEPTNMSLTAVTPGVLWCRLLVIGQAAHARQAAQAVNAAEKAFQLWSALRQLEVECNAPERLHPALRQLDHPLNFNLGVIRAGDWPSTVPEICHLELRLGFNPGEPISDVKQAVLQRIDQATAADRWLRDNPPLVSFVGFHAEGAVYDLDTDIARALTENHRALTGRALEASPKTATIDNRFFELYYGIPNVCYGPSGNRLHATDEWVDLESVRNVTRVLAATLVEWCGVE